LNKLIFIQKVLASAPTSKPESIQINTEGGLEKLVENALNVFLLLGGIAIFSMFIYAGFLFVTSQGNPERVATARNSIYYAVIGIIIIAFSYLLVQYIIKRFN
jgi:ABC-type Fe3+ transport system permease subunit